MPDTTSIPVDQEIGTPGSSSCGCRPGFRTCDEANALYAFVAAAHAEYVRVRREEPGNGPGLDEALSAHRTARADYDRHVYGALVAVPFPKKDGRSCAECGGGGWASYFS